MRSTNPARNRRRVASAGQRLQVRSTPCLEATLRAASDYFAFLNFTSRLNANCRRSDRPAAAAPDRSGGSSKARLRRNAVSPDDSMTSTDTTLPRRLSTRFTLTVAALLLVLRVVLVRLEIGADLAAPVRGELCSVLANALLTTVAFAPPRASSISLLRGCFLSHRFLRRRGLHGRDFRLVLFRLLRFRSA